MPAWHALLCILHTHIDFSRPVRYPQCTKLCAQGSCVVCTDECCQGILHEQCAHFINAPALLPVSSFTAHGHFLTPTECLSPGVIFFIGLLAGLASCKFSTGACRCSLHLLLHYSSLQMPFFRLNSPYMYFVTLNHSSDLSKFAMYSLRYCSVWMLACLA